MACVSFSHYAEAPVVVVVLQEDPLDHFEFDFLGFSGSTCISTCCSTIGSTRACSPSSIFSFSLF